MKINEVYVDGGDESNSAYAQDFIELYNSSDSAVSLGGCTLQYTPATGSSAYTQLCLFASDATIQAHHFYLVACARGLNGPELPAADAQFSCDLSATGGMIALASGFNQVTIDATTHHPNSSNVIDFVGYGSSADAYEGAGPAPAPAPSATSSIARVPQPGTDTDNNNVDFAVQSPPTPTNSTATPPLGVTPTPPGATPTATPPPGVTPPAATPTPTSTPTPPTPASHRPDILFAVGDTISDGVYAPTLQRKDEGASADTPTVCTFYVQNKGSANDSLALRGEAPQGWTVHYFDALTGGNDITAEVTGNGYTNDLQDLPPGTLVPFRIELEPGTNIPNNTAQDVQVTVSSSDPSPAYVADIITLHMVGEVWKPDALVRLAPVEGTADEDTPFVGNDLYDPNDPNQTLSTLNVPGQSQTYQVQAQNDGATDTPLAIQMPAPPAGWTVHVYDALVGGNDITAQVLSANGWNTPSLRPNETYEVRVEVAPSLTTFTGTTLSVNVIGGSVVDTVKIACLVQSIAGIQYSVDNGDMWQDVTGGSITVQQYDVVIFRAVKGDPTVEWPKEPYKPEWKQYEGTYYGDTVWLHFPEVTPAGGDGVEVSVECGNSLSVHVHVTDNPGA